MSIVVLLFPFRELIYHVTITQGRPPATANPGLECCAPSAHAHITSGVLVHKQRGSQLPLP